MAVGKVSLFRIHKRTCANTQKAERQGTSDTRYNLPEKGVTWRPDGGKTSEARAGRATKRKEEIRHNAVHTSAESLGFGLNNHILLFIWNKQLRGATGHAQKLNDCKESERQTNGLLWAHKKPLEGGCVHVCTVYLVTFATWLRQIFRLFVACRSLPRLLLTCFQWNDAGGFKITLICLNCCVTVHDSAKAGADSNKHPQI